MPTVKRDRAGALAAAGAIHIGLIYLLITGLGIDVPAKIDSAMQLIEVGPPPPPPIVEVVPPPQPSKRAEGAAAPPNKRSKATDVVAPPPLIPPPLPPPIAAAPTPGQGTQASAGAAEMAGPGTGAGGTGNGLGSGGAGDGDGGGDDDDRETPPREIMTDLRFRDFPGEIADRLPGKRLELRFRVEVDGRVSACRAVRSSGDFDVDAASCALAQRRFRLEPARDGEGRAVSSVMDKALSWTQRND